MKPSVASLVMMGLALAVTGCLTPRGDSPPVKTYHLAADVASQTPEPGVGQTGPILLVGVPQSDPGFDTPRMAYRTRPYELSYFSASQWADAPARMLHPLLISSLEHEGSWSAVVTASTALRADYRLDVSALVLVHEFDTTPSRLRLSWKAQVIRLHDGRPIGARRFETAQAATSDDAYGGVRAANQALARLLGEMSAWARACVTNHQKAPC